MKEKGFKSAFSPSAPRFVRDACSDDSCIKKVSGGLVARYCGPRLQEDGCVDLPGGGVRCACSQDLCNGARRTPAAGVTVVTLVTLVTMVAMTAEVTHG